MGHADRNGVFKLIAGNSFFSHCTPEEIEKIASLDTGQSYKAGEFIVRQGTTDPSAFILLEGVVVLNRGEMSDITIADLGPGSMFGSIPFLPLSPRETNVIAKTKVLVLKIDRPMIDSLPPATINNIALQFMQLLYGRVQNLNETIGGLKKDLHEVCVSFKTMNEGMESSIAVSHNTKVVSRLLFARLDQMRS